MIRIMIAAVLLAGCAPRMAEFDEGSPVFEGRLAAVSDVDMSGSAYADGKLEPLAGAMDTLSLIDPAPRSVATAPASSSVISWPQVLAVTADGRFAYVVETRGPAPDGVSEMSTPLPFREGRKLTAVDLTGVKPRVVATTDVGRNPLSASLSPDGRWLAVVNEQDGGQIVIVELVEGLPGRKFVFPVRWPVAATDEEPLPRTLVWSPRGDWLAANVSLKRVAFYRLLRDEAGAPKGVVQHGPAIEVGRRISRGVWTPDGRHYLTPDINVKPGSLNRLFQGAGTLTVIAFDAGERARHRVTDVAKVGGGPEGIALSPDGRRVVTINMERTFLPEVALLNIMPGRDWYSVTLLDLDPATGALAVRDTLAAEGILPEDAVFDARGENLAVAVFHRRRGEDRKRGFVDFFVVREGKLSPGGTPVGVARGVHDLERLP